MKHLLSALFLCLAVTAFGQFRMVSNGIPSWTSLNDSIYQASVSFSADLTGFGYLANQIDTTFRLFTGTEQLYRVDSVWNASFSSADIRVVEISPTNGSPAGQVMVFAPQGQRTIPQAPFGSTGSTAQLQSAIVTWNARYNGVFSATNNGNSLPDSVFVISDSLGMPLIHISKGGGISLVGYQNYNSLSDSSLAPFGLVKINIQDSLDYYFQLNSGNNGDFFRYNGTTGLPEWNTFVVTPQDSILFGPEFAGEGSSISPITLSQQGANDGQVLAWDNTLGRYAPTNFPASTWLKPELESGSVEINQAGKLRIFNPSGQDTIEFLNPDGAEFRIFSDKVELGGARIDVNSANIYLTSSRFQAPAGQKYYLIVNENGQIDTLQNLPIPNPTWLKTVLESPANVAINSPTRDLTLDIRAVGIGSSHNITSVAESAIVTGFNQDLSAQYGAIIGGADNDLGLDESFVIGNAQNSVIIGGLSNRMISGAQNSVIAGCVGCRIRSTNSFATGSINYSEPAAQYSMITGFAGRSYLPRQQVQGAGKVTKDPPGAGYNQVSKLQLVRRWGQHLQEYTPIDSISLDTTRKTYRLEVDFLTTVEGGGAEPMSVGDTYAHTVRHVVISNGNVCFLGPEQSDTPFFNAVGTSFVDYDVRVRASGNYLVFEVQPGDQVGGVPSNPAEFKCIVNIELIEMSYSN